MSLVQYTLEDTIAIITMDDGKVNALSPTMIEELGAVFDRAEQEAKAVILAGRPGRFCAGFDLKIMMSGPKAASDMIMSGGELYLRLYEFKLPLVVAVSGHALAGGVLLAACGDTRIGIKGDFKLGLNEVEKGIPVPVLAHELARDRLDPRELTAAVVQAKIYDPESALAVGWLDRLVDGAELANSAMTEAKRLAAMPSRAYALSKKSLRKHTIEYVRESMESNLKELLGGG